MFKKKWLRSTKRKKRKRTNSLRRDGWVVAAILLISIAFFWFQFWDWVCLPSSGDGINHLYYFSRVLDTGFWFTGRMPIEHPELFGGDRLLFYPTGVYLMAAVVTAPFRWLGWGASYQHLRFFFIGILSVFPALLYCGARFAFPKFSRLAVFLAATFASTLAFFPYRAIGEGGLSRITAQVLAIPLIFYWLKPAKWESRASLIFLFLFFISYFFLV